MMRHSILITSLFAALVSACSDSGPSAAELNKMLPPGGEGASAGSSGSGTTAGSGGSGSTVSSGGSSSGGSAGSTVTPEGGSSGSAVGGTGGSEPTAGTAGSGGSAPSGPYDPRSGTFKMLVLTRTAAFRHDGAIGSGMTMLTQIAQEQGFQVDFKGSVANPDQDLAQQLSIAEIDASVTAENLANYEIIFHLNTTGDMFTPEQQQIYEDWMTNNGAFAGVHAATDTENGWDFYSDVTGQYYNGHGAQNTPDQIQFEAAAVEFPALKGLPNPWSRNEEWYKFDNYQVWSVLPGFQILGRKAADGQPIMWTREWGNFRAFYTGIGHDTVVFEDPQVKQHLTGGIMWAVRRERCIEDQADPTCP